LRRLAAFQPAWRAGFQARPRPSAPARALALALAVGLVPALGALAGRCAAAQAGRVDWPQRPVHVLVPYAAGGNTDSQARIVSERLAAFFAQPFVVENHPGAAGAIAMEQAAHAAPGASLVLFASVAQFAVLPRIQKVGYDPAHDFQPVSIVGISPSVLGIAARIPARSLDAFIDYARAHPGALNYGSGGSGSIGHLAGALFAARAGLQMTHVPYKGGAPAVADLVAGSLDLYFGNAAELIPYAGSGRITLLAVAAAAPLPQLPGVPPIAGRFPGFTLSSWNGYLLPASAPPEVAERLAAAVGRALGEPATRASLERIGVTPVGSSPEAFARLLREEQPRWDEAIRLTGLAAP
jgi:tripartite-type tricarboxylate transporter receptor subunit TctC